MKNLMNVAIGVAAVAAVYLVYKQAAKPKAAANGAATNNPQTRPYGVAATSGNFAAALYSRIGFDTAYSNPGDTPVSATSYDQDIFTSSGIREFTLNPTFGGTVFGNG